MQSPVGLVVPVFGGMGSMPTGQSPSESGSPVAHFGDNFLVVHACIPIALCLAGVGVLVEKRGACHGQSPSLSPVAHPGDNFVEGPI